MAPALASTIAEVLIARWLTADHSRQQIRDLLTQNRPLVMGGVYDGLSTRLAHRAGFEVLFVGGFSVAATLLGRAGLRLPDADRDGRRGAARLPADGPAGAGRCRHRLRQRAERHPHGRAVSERRRRRLVPRRSGVAEALRPHARQAGGRARRVARQAARGARDAWRARPASWWRAPTRAPRSASTRRSRAARRRAISAPTRCSSRRPSRSPSWSRSRAPSPDRRSPTWSSTARRRCSSPDELHQLGFDLIVTPLAGLLSSAKALQDTYALLRRDGTMRDAPRSLDAVRRLQPARRAGAALRARAALQGRVAVSGPRTCVARRHSAAPPMIAATATRAITTMTHM